MTCPANGQENSAIGPHLSFMMGFAVFTGVSGVLQLLVPTYAFRLIRRFGVQRVGWFVVTAFSCMAMLHIVEPLKPIVAGLAPGVSQELVHGLSAVFLLIGMCHMETLYAEKEKARSNGETLADELDDRVEKETADLTDSNRKLHQQISLYEQSHKVLQESEAQYRALFMESPQAMWIFDRRSCRFLAVNKAALRQYGFSPREFNAMTARELIVPSELTAFMQDVARTGPEAQARRQWQHCRKDGTRIDVEVTTTDLIYANCPARLVVATDVTQRHRRELELRRAQKTEVIGRMAGHMGHHLRSIIATIEHQTDLMARNPNGERTEKHLQQISAAATCGAVLTRQLRVISGHHQLQVESLDLRGLVTALTPVVRRLAGELITLQFTSGFNIRPVLADRYLVEQILINLVQNARDAMPTGGVLTIGTTTVRVDESQTAAGGRRAGRFICLSVRDSGCGIPPEIQDRLFEPFFTAGNSGGMGLGLATVFGAVKQQSGWVEFFSELGTGTEFRVFLPCASNSTTPVQKESPADLAPVRGTVLLVEPEERVRGMTRWVLSRENYHVIEADTSSIALILWEENPNIDLLLTDFRLPDGSGCDLANQLRRTKPNLKVVYTSDHTPDAQSQKLALRDGFKFLPKPCSPKKLLETVREFLGHAS